MGFFGDFFRKKNQESSTENLPPDVRAVFDRMMGIGSSRGTGTSKCSICGQPNTGSGLICQRCVELSRSIGKHSIHLCGGCGAGFLVEPNVEVFTFSDGGVARVFCACCLEHLRGMVTGGDMAMPSTPKGYDIEGQALNASHSGMSLIEKLKSRPDQAPILGLIQHKAIRTGTSYPEPIFIPEAGKP